MGEKGVTEKIISAMHRRTALDLFSGIESSLESKAQIRPARNIVSPFSYQFFGTEGGTPSYARLVDSYRSWVYTAIDKIAKTIAMRPIQMFTLRGDGGRKILDPMSIYMRAKELKTEAERTLFLKDMGVEKREVTSHPFLDLVRRPNDIMSKMVLWYETVVRMEIGGLCAWYLPRNGLGLPGEVWALPLTKTAIIKPNVTRDMKTESWSYRDGSINETFAREDIVAMKYPNPASPWLGFSPLMAQLHPYDIDTYLMQQQRALLKNMGVPGIHLHTDQSLVDEQLNEIKRQIREQFGSAAASGDPWITHSGLKADKAGWSNREMRTSEISKDMRERIVTSYDLSEAKPGLEVPSNRANMEVLDETFVKECIGPKCTLIEEQINTFLLPRYDRGLFVEFNLPDAGDKEFDLKEAEFEVANLISTVNDYLKRKGRQTVPWGDAPWIPFNLIQYGTEEPGLPPPPKGVDVEEKASARRMARQWRSFVLRIAPWEKMVSGQMKGYFRSLETDVLSRLNKLGPQVEAQYNGWSRKAVQEHIAKKGVGDNINIDKKAEAKRLKLLLDPPVTTMVDGEGKRFLREVGAALVFNVSDPKVQKWIGTRMEQFSEAVAGTTFDDIKVILRRGFSEGEPLSAIADTLREKFDSYDKYRAPLIARTEVVAANNMADVLAIRQAGIEDKLLKTWITAGDEAVRPTHAEAGERYAYGIPIDEMFQVGGDEMDVPGNGSDPGENISCRCAMGWEKA